MKKLISIALSSVLLVGVLMSAAVQAEKAAKNADDAEVVTVDVKDGVTVNTGNETVDDAANLVAKCAEKKLALDACPGGVKGIACRKGIEMGRYKGVECPNL